MRFSTMVASGALAACASAANNYLGFNSGATLADRSAKFKADFEAEFKTAQALKGAPGTFNAVRLYTNIQAYSDQDPIEAFEAAIDTKTYILLGVWASGTDNIDKELAALTTAVKKYGSKLTDLVIGISIGSEDLYRDSVTGIKNKSGVGNTPDNIISFIKKFKSTFANSPLGKTPVGHVDTWDVWTNSTIKPVIDAIDWIGVDEYPFYETGKGNSISNAAALFDRAYQATIGVAGGKPVWVTETGWPFSGPDWDQAQPSVDNAKKYWQEIGCRTLFNKTPTFWYNLRDSNPDNKVKFAITDNLSTTPRFDLTCPKHFDADNSSSSSGTDSTSTATKPGKSTATGGSAQATGSDSNNASGSDAQATSGASGAKQTGSSTGAAPAQKTTDGHSAAAGLKAGPVAALAAVALAGFALL